MRIIVDIMSGDKAPLEQLMGAYEAAKENPLPFTVIRAMTTPHTTRPENMAPIRER